MMESSSKRNTPPGRPLILFIVGILVGVGAGLLLGSGRLSRESLTFSPNPTDTSSITLVGPASETGPRGDLLSKLLDPGTSDVTKINRTREVLALIDSVKPGEIGDRIDEVFARRRGNQGYDLITNLYQKWVEADPAAALQHAEGLEGKNRTTALNTVLSARAVKEPYEVIAWIEEHGTPATSRSGFYAALRSIAQDDPEAAIALGESSKAGAIPDLDPGFLYAIWAEKDPRAAATKASLIPQSQARINALGSIARQWAQEDPKSAWEWGNGLERAADQNSVFRRVIGAMVGNGDTSQAVAFLETMPPGRGRAEALGQIAGVLSSTDPEQAYELVKSLTMTTQDDQAYSTIFYQWAKSDPARVFQVGMDELGPGNARNTAIQQSINELASRDLPLAMEMIGKIDDETLGKNSYSVARALAQSDRTVAISWAEGLPEGNTKENAMSNIFSEWAQEEPTEAATYAMKIDNEQIRRRSLGNTLSQWGQEDAVDAMTWAVKHLGAEEQASLIPGNLLGTWVYQDARGAADWVSQLPPGKLRDASVPNLISSWANHDLVAAGEWLKQLPKGDARDQGVQNYVSRVYNTDPEAALAWAGSISDESNRQSQLESYAGRYLKKEPQRARRWIASSSLSPERQAELLKRAENR